MVAATESLGGTWGEHVDIDARYELDAKRVAAELVNGELVVIDFLSGKYHGVRGGGVLVWRALEAGFSPREIITRLAEHSSAFDEPAALSVVAFAAQLEAQGLFTRSARGAPALASNEVDFTTPFAPPELDTRDDLSDYLALDPIHDVDERGWPNARR